MDPRVTLDTNVGALVVELEQGDVARTVEFDDAHIVDLDSDDRVLSLEILAPERMKLSAVASRFGFVDRLPLIHAEMRQQRIPVPVSATAVSDLLEAKSVEMHGFAAPPSGDAARAGSRGTQDPRELDLVS